MARVINGAVYIPSFVPTINPGEYILNNVEYNNQADATGNGAYDIQVGFLLYSQATDPNLGTPVPGAVVRYKITAITVINSDLFNATVLYDDFGVESDLPSNDSYGAVCQYSPGAIDHLALTPAEQVYRTLPSGFDIAVINNNLREIATDFSPKTGIVPGPSFSGSPKEYAVVYATPLISTEYGVYITSSATRVWSVTNQSSNGFTINSNANTAFTEDVVWTLIAK